ncbi:CCA tRNA nucleotidyltransferase [Chloroflexota bacterium]
MAKDMQITIPETFGQILKDAQDFFYSERLTAFLVGGMVRDMVLGRATADADITLNTNVFSVAKRLAMVLGGKPVTMDAENGTVRIVLPDSGNYIDITTMRGDIHEDIYRRDFTINALAVPLENISRKNGALAVFDTSAIIDPSGGMADLENKILRAVSHEAFRQDAARLLRAVRLTAEYGLKITPETKQLIRRDAPLAANIAGERTREELLRLFSLPEAGEAAKLLDQLGILTAIIPELEAARGVSQPGWHHWAVLEHSLRTIDAVSFVLRRAGCSFAPADALEEVPWSADLEQHFKTSISQRATRYTMVNLAALLHDIAKPETRTIDENGRERFINHPALGSELCEAILKRLRLSKKETQIVQLMVKYHLRPNQMANEGLPTVRAIYRFFRETDDTGIDILFLSLADHLATRGPTLIWQEWQRHTGLVGHVLAERTREAARVVPPRLITGDDLIQALDLTPGPLVGRLLSGIAEARAAGEISNQAEALALAKKLLYEEKSL